ncbi:hypothetical protein [Nitrobacter sp. TKz-YC01]|uniref:hypothetical protein n=1 Tax=Nitrobacter sp. TKz-YC01 TaxID=3398703 RepID=UPI003A101CBD
MPNLDPLEAIAASELASASLFASLVPALIDSGALSSLGAREIYENALLMLETRQGSEPGMQRVYEAARGIIEARLRRQ